MIPMNEFQNIRKDLHGKFLLLRAASEKNGVHVRIL